MRLLSMSFRGITRFEGPDPVTINFDDLGGGLIAVVGSNGSGKTTAVECVVGGLFKVFPSRPGSLYDAAHGRDAFIELTFEDGPREIKTRVQIDADKRTMEAYLFEDGRSMTTGRAAEFDAEVEKRFGSLDLLLASVFSAQGRQGNFLLMPKTQRKGLFVELLGLSHLEALSQAASEERKDRERDLSTARASVAVLEDQLRELPTLRESLTGMAEFEAIKAAARLTAAEQERQAVADLEQAKAAGEKLAGLEREVKLSREALDAANRDQVIADGLKPAAEKRAAERRAAVSARQVDQMEARARERHANAVRMIDQGVEQAKAILAEEAVITEAVNYVIESEAKITGITAYLETWVSWQVEADKIKSALQSAQKRAQDARAASAREAEGLTLQADLMGLVPCATEPGWMPITEGTQIDLTGTCPLLANARAAKERLASMPPDAIPEALALELAGLEEQVQLATDNRLRLEAEAAAQKTEAEILVAALKSQRELAARAQLIAPARVQVGVAAKNRAATDSQLAQDIEAARKAVRDAEDEQDAIEADLDADLELAKNALVFASINVFNASSALEAAEARLKESQTNAPNQTLAAATLVGMRSLLADAEREHRAAIDRRATLAEQVRALESKLSDLEQRGAAVAHIERELGDWLLLEQALGKDGVQALEIDAAGPEVARLTNELLDATYGPRFSIAFETLREKKSKPGEFSEAFDVRVFDGGAERAVEALSGGERVVVGEAVGLAISIFNARKSGVRWRTIFRDETAGALDPENASRYVAMLRKALALGGFEQCVFIAHLPAVYEAADVQLYVVDGRVTTGRQEVAA